MSTVELFTPLLRHLAFKLFSLSLTVSEQRLYPAKRRTQLGSAATCICSGWSFHRSQSGRIAAPVLLNPPSMATSFPKQAEKSSYHEKPLQQRRRLFNQREAEETFSTVFFTQACRARARGLAGALHPTQEISLRAGTEAGRWWKMRAGQKKEAHFPFLSRQIRGPEAAFRMSHIRNIWNTRSLLCVPTPKSFNFQQH